jgi:hypothetical protein
MFRSAAAATLTADLALEFDPVTKHSHVISLLFARLPLGCDGVSDVVHVTMTSVLAMTSLLAMMSRMAMTVRMAMT